MSNQAPKMIEWDSDESVVRAMVPNLYFSLGGYEEPSAGVWESGVGGYMGDDWAEARLHPEVARLDAARNAVLAYHGPLKAEDNLGGGVVIVSYTKAPKPSDPLSNVVGRGENEVEAIFDAASRIASAPSPDAAEVTDEESWKIAMREVKILWPSAEWMHSPNHSWISVKEPMGTGRITPYLYTQPEAWLAARAHENWPKWEQSRRKLLGLPAPVSPEPEKEESHELHDGAAHPSLQESGDRSADDYRPSKFHLSNSEIRSTGILCGGAVQNIARELLELRSKSPVPPASYSPFNAAGTMTPPSPEMVEEVAGEGAFDTFGNWWSNDGPSRDQLENADTYDKVWHLLYEVAERAWNYKASRTQQPEGPAQNGKDGGK